MSDAVLHGSQVPLTGGEKSSEGLFCLGAPWDADPETTPLSPLLLTCSPFFPFTVFFWSIP